MGILRLDIRQLIAGVCYLTLDRIHTPVLAELLRRAMTHQRPVSVIIPVYNTAPYLSACLDTVLAQTHTALEVIAVDDGSTDATPAILADYAARDPRLRVLHTPASGSGPSVARNLGLRAATGEYFCFVDSDDLCDPDMVGTLLAALDRCPGAMFATAPLATFTGEQCTGQSRAGAGGLSALSSQFSDIPGREAALRMLYQTGGADGFTVSPVSKLFRMEVREGLGFTDGIIYEDLELLPRLTAPLRAVVGLRTPIYHYRIHSSSLLGRFTPRRLQVMEAVERLRRTFAADPELRRAADTRLFAASFNMLLHLSANPGTHGPCVRKMGNAEASPLQLAPALARRIPILLRQYRRSVLFNGKARFRDRMGALCVYLLGPKGVAMLLRTFPALSRRLSKR